MTDDGQSCSRLSFLAPYDQTAATWTLTVERLEHPRILETDEIAAALAEYGIEIEIREGGQWNTTTIPDGVDLGAVMQDVFSDWIEGPWAFTLDVPGA